MPLALALMSQVFTEPSFAEETLDLKSDSIQPDKYSFAPTQEAPSLQIIPGEEARVAIYFYNVDGNRITHITLEMDIAPPLHDTEVKF